MWCACRFNSNKILRDRYLKPKYTLFLCIDFFWCRQKVTFCSHTKQTVNQCLTHTLSVKSYLEYIPVIRKGNRIKAVTWFLVLWTADDTPLTAFAGIAHSSNKIFNGTSSVPQEKLLKKFWYQNVFQDILSYCNVFLLSNNDNNRGKQFLPFILDKIRSLVRFW